MLNTNNLQNREAELLHWLQSETQFSVETLLIVSGDASFRRYFRFTCDATSYIAVDAPPEKESNHEFFHIAKSYSAAGVRVPHIVEVDLEKGFWVLEDFGDNLLSDFYSCDVIESLYEKALNALVSIQSVMQADGKPLPAFDDALLDTEFHLFNHWLVEVHLDLELSDVEKGTMLDAQALIRNVFKEQPQAGVHRDYHSRNLMVLSGDSMKCTDHSGDATDHLKEATDHSEEFTEIADEQIENCQIGIIDFQDAVIGPVTYDAVSLLRDCYVVWPKDMVSRLLSNWLTHIETQYSIDEFTRWFDFVGMQRHIKASGIFCRLSYRDGKSLYLDDIPRTLEYLIDIAAQYPETKRFSDLIANKVLPAVLAKEDV